MQYDLTLPGTEAHYSTDRDVYIKVDNSICGKQLIDKKGNAHTNPATNTPWVLQQSTQLGPILAPWVPKPGTGGSGTAAPFSIERVSEAAMRYFMPGDSLTHPHDMYQEELFLVRRGFGRALRQASNGSFSVDPGSLKHQNPELRKLLVEQFAYGVAIAWVTKALGITDDRISFIKGGGVRADFRATLTLADLAAHPTVQALAPAGFVLNVEVRGRTGFASYSSKSGINVQGGRMLADFAKKAASQPTAAFLGIVVSLPTPSVQAAGKTRLLIADPNEPEILPEDARLAWLLDQIARRSMTFGLWGLAAAALDWRAHLDLPRGFDDPRAAAEMVSLRERLGPRATQTRIQHREFDGVTYNGWVFSSAVMSLGSRGNRRTSREEVRRLLDGPTVGRYWFSGVDVELQEAVTQRNRSFVLQFGLERPHMLQQPSSARLRPMFVTKPITPDDLDEEAARIELRQALEHW